MMHMKSKMMQKNMGKMMRKDPFAYSTKDHMMGEGGEMVNPGPGKDMKVIDVYKPPKVPKKPRMRL